MAGGSFKRFLGKDKAFSLSSLFKPLPTLKQVQMFSSALSANYYLTWLHFQSKEPKRFSINWICNIYSEYLEVHWSLM